MKYYQCRLRKFCQKNVIRNNLGKESGCFYKDFKYFLAVFRNLPFRLGFLFSVITMQRRFTLSHEKSNHQTH